MLMNPVIYGIESEGTPEYMAIVKAVMSEADMLATLRHDRILGFNGVCVSAATGHPKYIVVELAENSLRAYLKSLGRLFTPKELARCLEDILSGLAYLHAFKPNPIVHRDLKPENILMFRIHGNTVFKIGDVGLSRAVNNASSRGASVQSAAGSSYYMAPELFARVPRYDAKADMFSFGIMVAELVTSYMIPGHTVVYSSEQVMAVVCVCVCVCV